MQRIFILGKDYNRRTDKVLAKKQIGNRLVLLVRTNNLDRPHIDNQDNRFELIKRHFQIVKYRRANDPETEELQLGPIQLNRIPPSPIRTREFFRKEYLADYVQEQGDVVIENKDPLIDG